MMPLLAQSMNNSYVDGLPLASVDGLQYRHGPSYPYNSKPYYPMQGFSNGYPEDTGPVEYSMYPSSYQSVQDPNYMINYRLGSNATPSKPSSAMFVDPESAAYGYPGPGTTAGLTSRPTSTADSASFSFQNVAAGLSNSLSSNERPLPAPNRRPLPSSAPRPYRTDSLSSVYGKHSQPSTSGTSPPSPVPEEAASYSTFDGSPSAAYHTSAISSQLSRPNDLYTTSSSDSMLHGSEASSRMPGGGPELTYRYEDTTIGRRGSTMPSGMSMSSSQSYLNQPHGLSNSFHIAGSLGSNGGVDHHRVLAPSRPRVDGQES